ncbi:MAG: GGDEF domain-containing protein [Immundisolibacter sp.]|uniref:GGDEF domain-containing protein n=1 Tax=Immundisolibacter sp. TaxID=1934948 RepID=UPI003EE26761
MTATTGNTVETLLRQAVPQLCLLASGSNPGLREPLDALRQIVLSDKVGTGLQAALEKVTQSAKNASAPGKKPRAQTQAAIDTAEGRLIRDLLKHLVVPPALEPLTADLERALGTPADEAGRRRLAEQLVHVVVEARGHTERRQAELQDFLKQTVGRLLQLETALNEASALTREGGARALEASLVTEAQFLKLRATSTDLDDVDQLKDFIGDHLDHLQEHLSQQDNAGASRQRRLEQQLSQLSEQVAHLNSETVTLRSRLDVTTEEALRDPLTGAFNRLAYDRRAALEVARWASDGSALSMIVCDIDHFKRINDTFGHAAGDKVLKEVVRLLQEQLRSSDFVARYGGEEFVVLLNGANGDAALHIAEKLRRTIKAAPFRSRGERVAVTISCGVSTFSGDDNLEAVFERADAALYVAKTSGRDRCMQAECKAA